MPHQTRPPEAPVPFTPVPLTTVAVGALATLHDVRDPDSRALLRSLGLTDACRLRLCKMGDPCIIQVRATRIGLSRAVARTLYVVPDDGANG
jgi:Fe2+ transport system protein FeoA